MIKLGNFVVSLYPNNGIVFENSGTLVFNGKCMIGNNSYISIGKSGHVNFGNKVVCSASLKIASYNAIEFEDNVLIGWNCMLTDTDFHRLKTTDYSPSPKAYGSIHIGKGTWIAANCVIMKNTMVPAKCVVASNSLLNKDYQCDECTLIGGQPGKVLKTGVYRDINDDMIYYE